MKKNIRASGNFAGRMIIILLAVAFLSGCAAKLVCSTGGHV